MNSDTMNHVFQCWKHIIHVLVVVLPYELADRFVTVHSYMDALLIRDRFNGSHLFNSVFVKSVCNVVILYLRFYLQ